MRTSLVIAICLGFTASTVEACRQALVFGLDVSASVDEREYRLQREGLASALNSSKVREELLNPSSGFVDVSVFEWSGTTDQTIIIPWTTILQPQDLAELSQKLLSRNESTRGTNTAIGPAVLFGASLLADRPNCWRRTLDISGDGKANAGVLPENLSLADLPSDIIVNALVIGAGDQSGDDQRQADIKELSSYYRTRVIRGPDAFVETALGFGDYAAAMERKILRELVTIVIGQANSGPSTGQ